MIDNLLIKLAILGGTLIPVAIIDSATEDKLSELVLVVAAGGAAGIIYRKIVRPLMEAADDVKEMRQMLKRWPLLEKKVAKIERKVEEVHGTHVKGPSPTMADQPSLPDRGSPGQ